MVGIGMGMGMGIRMTQTLRQTLSLRQAIILRADYQINIRRDLLNAVTGFSYTPRAECPHCGHVLAIVEILAGFLSDPHDTTTACPRCKRRFQPRMICWHESGRSELPFYCRDQTLAALPKTMMTPEMMRREHPQIFHSLTFHFGGIKNAYEAIGRTYPYSEAVEEWADKVVGFLGDVPDTMIASVAGVSVYKVRKLRRDYGIPGFRTYPARQYEPVTNLKNDEPPDTGVDLDE